MKNSDRVSILKVLKQYIAPKTRLLEILSGNADNAIFFAEYFKDLQWVTSEIKERHAEIKKQLIAAKISNIHGPHLLKIGSHDFPDRPFDYVFTADSIHNLSWKEGKTLFKLMGKRLREGALVFLYGPFTNQGQFSSLADEALNKSLKERDSKIGIRNLDDVLKAMEKVGFKLLSEHEMPESRRLIVFERLPFGSNLTGSLD